MNRRDILNILKDMKQNSISNESGVTVLKMGIAEAREAMKQLRDRKQEIVETAANAIKECFDEDVAGADWQDTNSDWSRRKAVLAGEETPNIGKDGKELWYEKIDFDTVSDFTDKFQNSLSFRGVLEEYWKPFAFQDTPSGHKCYIGFENPEAVDHYNKQRTANYKQRNSTWYDGIGLGRVANSIVKHWEEDLGRDNPFHVWLHANVNWRDRIKVLRDKIEEVISP